jgi:serine/threonine protein kinase
MFLPHFDVICDQLLNRRSVTWDQLPSHEVIGQGSFGAVFITQYMTATKPTETVVVKKLLSTAREFTETFVKEAKILNGLEHKSIVSFKAVCKEPVAMMMEYVYFDLEIFGGDGKVSSLSNFLSCLDQNDW